MGRASDHETSDVSYKILILSSQHVRRDVLVRRGSMSTRQLLNEFIRLREELTTSDPTERWIVFRRGMTAILNSYRVQLAYIKARAEYATAHNEVPEKSRLFTKSNLRNLKEAAAVNREIGRRLSELKKSKRGVAATRAKMTKRPARRPLSGPARKQTRARRQSAVRPT